VQTRQIYTFSNVGARGWHERAEPLAAKGFDFFLTHACPDHGARGCVHLLSEDGAVLDDRRDLYDQAFLLLACAARWAVARDRRAIELADKTIAFLDRELRSPHGGWLEDDRGTLPRRQNPHMHLFEAFMALYKATGKTAYREYAANIFTLFKQVFYAPAEGVIWEYFDKNFDKQPHANIEPGHMFEWVWLLEKFRTEASTDVTEYQENLFARGVKTGETLKSHGFIVNKGSLSGKPPRGNRRLWPQMEYLKACLTMAAKGDANARERGGALINALHETYLSTQIQGLWVDEYDDHGAPVAMDVPASILYHLFEAVAYGADFKAGSLAP